MAWVGLLFYSLHFPLILTAIWSGRQLLAAAIASATAAAVISSDDAREGGLSEPLLGGQGGEGARLSTGERAEEEDGIGATRHCSHDGGGGGHHHPRASPPVAGGMTSPVSFPSPTGGGRPSLSGSSAYGSSAAARTSLPGHFGSLGASLLTRQRSLSLAYADAVAVSGGGAPPSPTGGGGMAGDRISPAGTIGTIGSSAHGGSRTVSQVGSQAGSGATGALSASARHRDVL